jgi:signal transduction histidine kinase
VKFSNQGAISIRVLLIFDDEAAIQVRFEIQDKGIGIAPETLKKLFSPFTQADGSTTRKYGGTSGDLQSIGASNARSNRSNERPGRRINVLVYR